jgi:hypothetical protein
MNDEVRKAVDIDYTAGELDRTAPERIWLQIDTSDSNSNRDMPWPGDDDVTWASDSIGGLEVQYIRADILRAELTRPTHTGGGVMGLELHFTPYYLLANCRLLCSAHFNREPNWVIASKLFAVGSTTARGLCHDDDIDPDATTVFKRRTPEQPEREASES